MFPPSPNSPRTTQQQKYPKLLTPRDHLGGLGRENTNTPTGQLPGLGDLGNLMCYMFDCVKDQLYHFMLGFNSVIPAELLSVFDYQELDLLI